MVEGILAAKCVLIRLQSKTSEISHHPLNGELSFTFAQWAREKRRAKAPEEGSKQNVAHVRPGTMGVGTMPSEIATRSYCSKSFRRLLLLRAI